MQLLYNYTFSKTTQEEVWAASLLSQIRQQEHWVPNDAGDWINRLPPKAQTVVV